MTKLSPSEPEMWDTPANWCQECHHAHNTICLCKCHIERAALSSVEGTAPTARERTLLIDRIAIDAELIRLRAELARAKDALNVIRAISAAGLSEARKESK